LYVLFNELPYNSEHKASFLSVEIAAQKNMGRLISEALRHVPVTSFPSKYRPVRNARAVFFITQYSSEKS